MRNDFFTIGDFEIPYTDQPNTYVHDPSTDTFRLITKRGETVIDSIDYGFCRQFRIHDSGSMGKATVRAYCKSRGTIVSIVLARLIYWRSTGKWIQRPYSVDWIDGKNYHNCQRSNLREADQVLQMQTRVNADPLGVYVRKRTYDKSKVEVCIHRLGKSHYVGSWPIDQLEQAQEVGLRLEELVKEDGLLPSKAVEQVKKEYNIVTRKRKPKCSACPQPQNQESQTQSTLSQNESGEMKEDCGSTS